MFGVLWKNQRIEKGFAMATFLIWTGMGLGAASVGALVTGQWLASIALGMGSYAALSLGSAL